MVGRNKVIGVDEAIEVVLDGDTVATGGFVGTAFPEHLAAALERRFLSTGAPADLTIIHAAGQGDGKKRGLNHFAHRGMIRCVIGGHWGLAPALGELALHEDIDAYCLPLGLISQWYRDVAAGRPGTVTEIGLHTFVDPRIGGGRLNRRSTEDVIQLVELGGRECLFFPSRRIDIALLRGTTSDAEGNITMEHETLTLESLAMAQAAKNSGGIVIVQVQRTTANRTLSPREVQIPGILVDAVVVSPPEEHQQTFGEPYNPTYTGETTAAAGSLPPMPLDGRKVIARQAAIFLRPNSVVNLGIGIPEGIASVADEEGVLDRVTLTVEGGAIGGVPSSGLSFGGVTNPQAIIDQPSQFDFYDGGGLDQAFLGLAEVDAVGNVNVSQFGPRIAGPGGFINITQRAKEVFFLGLFRAGAKVSVENGQLEVIAEGSGYKFVPKVQQITFSGRYARERGQEVYFITERCVLRLTESGLELSQIAPGIDLETDVLPGMQFEPAISDELTTMDPAIFEAAVMGLRSRPTQPMDERFVYDESDNVLYGNFEGLSLETADQACALADLIDARLRNIGRRVHVVVNYDNFEVQPPAAATFFQMIRDNDRYVLSRTRYSTNAFFRRRLGKQFTAASLEHRLYGSFAEVQARVESRSKPKTGQ
jgi:propionate CoA-transferase